MHVVCATDFSLSAKSAGQVAAILARRFGDTLVVAHAWEPMAAAAQYSTMIADPALDEALERRYRDELAVIAGEIRTAEMPVEERCLRGYAPAAVTNLAHELDARLTVVGTHGRRGLPRTLLGSVAERTVMLAERPILVVNGPTEGWASWARGDRPLKLLVGLDGSAASRAAIEWVGRLRQAGPCDLHFVHFYSPLAEAQRLGTHAPSEYKGADLEVVDIIEKELRPSIAHIPGAGPITLKVVPCWGSIAAALCVQASEMDADALVIGTHQRTGLARLRLGSTTQPVLQNVTVPVFCVPTTAYHPSAFPTLPRFKRILVSTDLSEFSNQAIPYAYALLQGRHGHVFICHVQQPHGGSVPDDESEERLRLQLSGFIVTDAGLRDVSTDVVVLSGESPADAIDQAANRLGVDAIVLASHGRSGLGRTLLGSVAQTLVNKSPRPVMVVRPVKI